MNSLLRTTAARNSLSHECNAFVAVATQAHRSSVEGGNGVERDQRLSPPLTLNRLHAALYHELLDGSKYPHHNNDDFINHAVDLTNRSNLISLLQRYDFATRKQQYDGLSR